MFKPALTVLGVLVLGFSSVADAAYTSGSVAKVCPSGSYPYSTISNATMSGACTGYRSTSEGACSGSSATYYSGFTCKTNYCKLGSACYNVCSSGSYPYSSISNATMSGACTGYRSTSGGSCSGSSATYYSGYSCKSGYCGSSCGTSCTSSCPSGYSYTSYSSSQCYTGSSSHTYCSTCASRPCYSGVKSAYSSCSAAGYGASRSSSKCGETTTSVQGGAGGKCTTLTCYTGGSNAKSSCAAAGYDSSRSSSKCGQTTVTVKLGAGTATCTDTTCYTGGSTKCSGLYSSSNKPANSTLSGTSCTGYNLWAVDGFGCAGSKDTYYTSFTCNSGYCKSGSSCVKSYSSCKAAGYLDSCASNCTATKVTVYNSSCSAITCYNCTNCTTLNPGTGTGCASCCTSAKPYCVNNKCSATCPYTNGYQCIMCAVADKEFGVL